MLSRPSSIEVGILYWVIWLLLWVLVGGLPLPSLIRNRIYKRERMSLWEETYYRVMLPLRLALAVILVIMILWGGGIPDASMIWLFAGWMIFWTAIETVIAGTRLTIKAAAVAVILIFVISYSVVSFFATYNNALYFDGFIQKTSGYPVSSEIPSNMVRLTTEELANSIARQHMSEFGSNTLIIDQQLTTYNGRLSWVVLVAREESWGATYRVAGLIIVDGNDPNMPPTIIKNETFAIADGLDFNPIIGAYGNAKAYGYYSIDTAINYGDVYPVQNADGEWVIAITAFQPSLTFVRQYAGIYTLDQQGNYLTHYSNATLPSWIVQAYDEQDFLECGISAWGSHKRGNGFDIFAPGFLWIAPSSNRVQISEDTRYIYDPDLNQIVAVTMVHPVRDNGDLSLAGAFKATPSGIYYYDLSDENMISGTAAGSVAMSKITERTGTVYYTAMELLYPMQVGNASKQVWFVPIYFESSSGLIGLAGLALVDSHEQNKVYVELIETSGATGSELVENAKSGFRQLYGVTEQPTNESGFISVNGTLTAKYEPYIKDGNTHQWLGVDNGTADLNVLVNSGLISDSEMLKIQMASPGDSISLTVDQAGVVRKVH